ncbi:hypothetical protein T492DRAFT_857953, partial [Pavlovales sp. CCMP2436]
QSALAINVLSPLAHQADVLFQQSALAAIVLSPLAHQTYVLAEQSALVLNVLSPLAHQTYSISPQSYSLPMHSSLALSPLHFMQATPSASARSDALAA